MTSSDSNRLIETVGPLFFAFASGECGGGGGAPTRTAPTPIGTVLLSISSPGKSHQKQYHASALSKTINAIVDIISKEAMPDCSSEGKTSADTDHTEVFLSTSIATGYLDNVKRAPTGTSMDMAYDELFAEYRQGVFTPLTTNSSYGLIAFMNV